jgi:hypothetical protein
MNFIIRALRGDYKVVSPWIVGVGPADEEVVAVGLGEHPDVVVAVVLTLPLHQAQLNVPLPRVPRDPLLKVLLQSIKPL